MKVNRIVLAGMFLVAGVTVASAQVKLSFNPEKGTKYEYQTELVQKTMSYVMGQDFDMVTEINVAYLMEIKDKTQEETQVQIMYREIAYKMSSPMFNMGYDSKKPDDKMFNNMIDQSFIVVIAPDGSVKSLTGMDEIAAKLNNSLLSGDPMGEQLKQHFSGPAMKSTFEQSFKIYPDNAVKQGDSWNSEFVMSVAPMTSNTKTKYTLKEISGNMAIVDVASDIEMNSSGNMEGKISGKQSGSMLVDIQTGIPVSSDITQILKGTINAQGFEIQMDMNNIIKTSISINK